MNGGLNARLWSLACVSVLALAGCVDTTEDTRGASPPAEPPAQAVRFLSDGTVLPPAADGVKATYVYAADDLVGQEPNIGITDSGAIFTTAWEATLRSTDGGLTWERVHTYRMAQGQVSEASNDPMLWVDAATDRVWVNHMYFNETDAGPRELTTGCFTMIWSDDDGASWTQRDGACLTPRVDHQKVATGPPGPDPNPHTGAAHPSVVYTCFNNRLRTELPSEMDAEARTSCLMSYDGGLTYPLQTDAFDGSTDCGGTAGHPAIAPDGTIVVPAAYKCGPELAVSRDSGLTWTVHDVPEGNGTTASIDPDAAFDTDGTLYFIWRDGDQMIRLARSDNLGHSWTGPWNATAPGLTSTRFHAVSAGDDGRVAMAYLGTSVARGTTWRDAEGEEHSWTGAPDDAPPDSLWHLYIVTMDDDGTNAPVFTSRQVTPDKDPVQTGCTSFFSDERRCRNLLDFIDSAVAPDGTFYVSYTEGCTVRGECAGRAGELDELEARDGQTAVAWLDGWHLLG